MIGGAAAAHASGPKPDAWDPSRGLLIAGATIVTMDDAHTVVPHGRVLVRDGRILEIGLGTGLNLPCYPGHVRRITALDVNPAMLRQVAA